MSSERLKIKQPIAHFSSCERAVVGESETGRNDRFV